MTTINALFRCQVVMMTVTSKFQYCLV